MKHTVGLFQLDFLNLMLLGDVSSFCLFVIQVSFCSNRISGLLYRGGL